MLAVYDLPKNFIVPVNPKAKFLFTKLYQIKKKKKKKINEKHTKITQTDSEKKYNNKTKKISNVRHRNGAEERERKYCIADFITKKTDGKKSECKKAFLIRIRI